jgi:hypothetical protein
MTMPTYHLSGPITINADIAMDAESESKAWDELKFRLHAQIYLAGYTPESDTSAEITNTDLAISRVA